MDRAIHADAAPKAVGRYPHARRVGDLLFLSGIGPRTPGSDAIPGNVCDADGRLLDYDIAAQTRSVFANVQASDLIGSLIKIFVFALLVTGVSCLRGLRTGGGASAVGRSTTAAVVSGLILITIADGLFAVLFYYFKI